MISSNSKLFETEKLTIMTINGVIVLIGTSQSTEVVGAISVYSSILTPVFLLIVRANNG